MGARIPIMKLASHKLLDLSRFNFGCDRKVSLPASVSFSIFCFSLAQTDNGWTAMVIEDI
ncbi:MAG TPA: hypothetical protein DCY88_29885 [Cyanobacteria bacterium UBA11372]|nr:hypothetical protein [Cyanobacteria bacterium UBA11372]